eukprot:CAMPEP_0117027226 /NCGR_PEP_ID=MMETSP0472-20121206/19922_1 /TAXON_ID=693140 ORGANISM="Tiarina fusus, Strain LIS" /NCGR_SAMPLE_ID=MMETSP0472 /ASSEMBLY_ACC=CAM_ASM_000603 /LENGTH=411 /DNA_ID=CAMNT_0004734415 /DNA_START=41 /DNA_END=1276 /DNA_ORIENTATION=+
MMPPKMTEAAASKAQLLAIIYNGRQFLEALEQFAAANFPDDVDDLSTTLAAKLSGCQREGKEERSATVGDTNSSRETIPTSDKVVTPQSSFTNTGHLHTSKSLLAESLDSPENLVSAGDQTPPIDSTSESLTAAMGLTRMRWAPITEKEGSETISAAEQESSRKRQRAEISFSRPVLQYCAATGTKKGSFKSGSEAARKLAGASDGVEFRRVKTGIGRVLRGERQMYSGHYFRYSDDTTTPMPTFPFPPPSLASVSASARQTKKHPDIQEEEDDDEDDEDAAADVSQSSDQVSIVHVPSSHEDESVDSPKSRKRPKSDAVYFGKAVVQYCATNGKQLGVFKSAAEAARALAGSNCSSKFINFKNAISRVLRGERPSYAGQYYRYVNDTTSPMPVFPIAPPKRGRKTQGDVE